MKKYVFKRILSAFFIVFIVLLINFIIIKLAPGDPITILAGLDNPSPEMIETLTKKYGLDQPLHIQFIRYITNLIRGDLGDSYLYDQPVIELIAERIGASLLLSLTSAFLAVIIGTAIGLYAAKNIGSVLDKIFSAIAYLFNAMPSFWLGLMGILIFASTFKILPTSGMTDLRAGYTGLAYYLDILKHLVLPACTLAAVQIPIYFRISKTSVLQVKQEDFITTFRVTGMSEGKIFKKYVLKNAILPIITVFGINLAYVVAGSTLIEIVFGWPGIGSLMYKSIMQRDYNVLMGVYLCIAISVAFTMIVVDLIYAWLDPRIRYD